MNDNTKSTVVESVKAKLPSLKTVGLFSLGAVAVAGTLALSFVANAVSSDIGHEILDLF